MTAFPTAKHLVSWARRVPRQRRIRRKAPLRQDTQGLQMATREPDRSRNRRQPHQRHLPPSAVSATPRPSWTCSGDHRARSTACSSRPGTSSPPARSTAIPAATTSRVAIPNARPDGSSPTSKSSDTSSRSNRQRQRHPTRSLPERGFLFSSSDNPRSRRRSGAWGVGIAGVRKRVLQARRRVPSCSPSARLATWSIAADDAEDLQFRGSRGGSASDSPRCAPCFAVIREDSYVIGRPELPRFSPQAGRADC